MPNPGHGSGLLKKQFVKPGGMLYQEMPSYVSRSITVFDASLLVGEALLLLQNATGDFIVVRRMKRDGSYYFYLYTLYEFKQRIRYSGGVISLEDALNLHEYTATQALHLQALQDSAQKPDLKSAVILDGTQPVGVIADENQSMLYDLPSQELFRSTATKPGKRSAPDDLVTSTDRFDSITHLGGGIKQERKPDFTSIHFQAEMPPTLEVGKTETLSVILSKEELQIAVGFIGDSKTVKVVDTALTIRVIPKRNLEIVGDSTVPDLHPVSEDTIPLFFGVRGTHAGQGEIWIVLCQGALPLSTIILKPEIVQKECSTDDVIRGGGIVMHDPKQVYMVKNQIQIHTVINGSSKRYRYTVNLPDIDKEFYSRDFQADILSRITPIVEKFDAAIAISSIERALLMEELEAEGNRLFKELFPDDLQQIFREKLDTIDHLKLYCEEPCIPWELLYIDKPGSDGKFFGELGLIRWIHLHAAPLKVKIRRQKAKFVAPRYPGRNLNKVQDECEMLQVLFSAEPVSPATRMEVVQALKGGDIDLFHFAGHGSGSSNDYSSCVLELELPDGVDAAYKNLTPAIVSMCTLCGTDGGNRPMIVLNACRSDKGSSFLTSATGFAQEFLKCGAGIFVGTQWAVEDEAAARFIKELYTELLSGKTVAQAIRVARASIRQMKDATFLAYAVYADPFTQVETESL